MIYVMFSSPFLLFVSIVSGVILISKSQRTSMKPRCEGCGFDVIDRVDNEWACPECGGRRLRGEIVLWQSRTRMNLGLAVLMIGLLVFGTLSLCALLAFALSSGGGWM
jgi:DNA-directed RNA polymerase subunit RPC12/RpoP